MLFGRASSRAGFSRSGSTSRYSRRSEPFMMTGVVYSHFHLKSEELFFLLGLTGLTFFLGSFFPCGTPAEPFSTPAGAARGRRRSPVGIVVAFLNASWEIKRFRCSSHPRHRHRLLLLLCRLPHAFLHLLCCLNMSVSRLQKPASALLFFSWW